jgi:hypothetical protein
VVWVCLIAKVVFLLIGLALVVPWALAQGEAGKHRRRRPPRIKAA